MRGYGQYCPISRASEILGERWTLLVIRNLLLGCQTFNAIAGGVPGMSRSLLVSRLRSLQDQGLVAVSPRVGGRGHEYTLTEAGRSLWDVIEPMAAWSRQWVELQPEHTDPSFVLWAWIHVHMRRERLPKRRVVVQFDFPQQPRAYRRFWMLVEHGEAELCSNHPRYDCDLFVTAENQAFTHWHVRKAEWGALLRSGAIQVQGPRQLARALPTWNERVHA